MRAIDLLRIEYIQLYFTTTTDVSLVQDIVFQLQRFVNGMSKYHEECKLTIEPTRNLFPIEVDLSQV